MDQGWAAGALAAPPAWLCSACSLAGFYCLPSLSGAGLPPGLQLISDLWHFCIWTDSRNSLLPSQTYRTHPGGNAPSLQADKHWQS